MNLISKFLWIFLICIASCERYPVRALLGIPDPIDSWPDIWYIYDDEINTKGSIFYIAYENEKPVAYLKVNIGEAQTEKQGNESMEIQRIYVLSECKGKRIGSRLMKIAEEEAVKANCKRVWLGVWEHNDGALAFYAKKGYKRFSEHIFMFGNDPQTDYLMEKYL